VSKRSASVELRELFARAASRPSQKLGAVYMEVLRELRPDLHRQLAGGAQDPSQDERRLNAFLLWLCDHWGPDDYTIDVEVSGLVLW